MIDGQLRAPGAELVSVFDRGFLYGDSVFETLRTYRGVPFELREHLARLARSASLVFIELPVPLEQLEAEVLAAIAAGQNPESYVRLMVTRGQGALGLDPRADIVTYCHHGARSLRALDLLRAAGFSRVRSLAGGIDGWAREVEPGMLRY